MPRLVDLPAAFRALVDQELRTGIKGRATSFHNGIAWPTPSDSHSVYVAMPSSVVMPVVQEFTDIALGYARKELGIDPAVTWFSKASPADVAVLYRERGDHGLQNLFVTRRPVSGVTFAKQPDRLYLNLALSKAPAWNVAVTAHESLHAYQYTSDPRAANAEDDAELEALAVAYEARFLKTYFPTLRTYS